MICMSSEIGKSEIVTRNAACGKAGMMNTQCEISLGGRFSLEQRERRTSTTQHSKVDIGREARKGRTTEIN